MSVHEFKPGVHIRHDDDPKYLPRRIRHAKASRDFLRRKLESLSPMAKISIENDPVPHPLCTVGELLKILARYDEQNPLEDQ